VISKKKQHKLGTCIVVVQTLRFQTKRGFQIEVPLLPRKKNEGTPKFGEVFSATKLREGKGWGKGRLFAWKMNGWNIMESKVMDSLLQMI